MKLYHTPGACSMACHIALEEAGAAFEPVVVPRGQNRTAEYLAVHPRGFVPVLEQDDGQRLTEAAAILLHVARRFPEARLLPEAGTVEEARAFEWLMWLTNSLHIAYACLWRPERFTDDPAARGDRRGGEKPHRRPQSRDRAAGRQPRLCGRRVLLGRRSFSARVPALGQPHRARRGGALSGMDGVGAAHGEPPGGGTRAGA